MTWSGTSNAVDQRGVLNLVAATCVTALEVAIFAFGMRHPPPPSEPSPIAVRLVTLPAPAVPRQVPAPTVPAKAAPSVVPMPPPPIASPVPEPPKPALVATPPKPLALEPQSPVPVPAVPPEKPRPPPRHAAQTKQLPSSAPAAPLLPSAPASEATPSVAEPAPGAHPSASGGGTMGARALYKPMPEIPEELRRHPMTVTAVARFRVGPDGTAAVELVQPTPIPLLNTALLAALQRWRFFPAMASGQPVASTIDIRIPVAVR